MQIVTSTVRVTYLYEAAQVTTWCLNVQKQWSECSACALPLILLHDNAVSQNAAVEILIAPKNTVSHALPWAKESRNCWTLHCVACDAAVNNVWRRMCRFRENSKPGFATCGSANPAISDESREERRETTH